MSERRRRSRPRQRARHAFGVEIGRISPAGRAYIQATFNNTIVTLTDPAGNVIVLVERRSQRLQGLAQEHAVRRAGHGRAGRAQGDGARAAPGRRLRQGPGSGREMAIRALQSAGVKVISITDTTPIPHNGCRPPKRRRV